MKSIAIIGASANKEKYSNKAVRAYKSQGFTVYPINPAEDTIEGLQAFKSVNDLPETPDMASFYVPPSKGLSIIEDVAAKGIKQVWFNPGSESDELLQKAEQLGLSAIVACSIMAVNVSPSDL